MTKAKEINKNITITLDDDTRLLVAQLKEHGFNPSAVVRKLLMAHAPALLPNTKSN